jgi:multiple sugar transport system ATP-binding protein
MDEPLSNLDAKLRVQTRTQIAQLQRRLGVTTVYVTHDQVEAMTMGDRVAVLKDGVLQQCDTPRRMYDHPDNVFVAGFIGSPAMNLLTLPVVDNGVQFGDSVHRVERAVVAEADNDTVTVGVRPEDLELAEHGLPVEVDVVEELGADAYIYGRTNLDGKEHQIIARVDGRRPPEKGALVHLRAKEGHTHLFDALDGHRLGEGVASKAPEVGRSTSADLPAGAADTTAPETAAPNTTSEKAAGETGSGTANLEK